MFKNKAAFLLIFAFVIISVLSSCINQPPVIPTENSDAIEVPDPVNEIKDVYWLDMELRLLRANLYRAKIQRMDDIDMELVPHRGPLSGAEADDAVPFMIVLNFEHDGLAKMSHEYHSQTGEILNQMIADAAVTTVEQVHVYLDGDKGYRHLYKLSEDFFDGWTEKEKAEFLAERPPEEFIDTVLRVRASDEFKNEKEKILANLNLREYLDEDADKITARLSETEKMLKDRGFTILRDINDPDWKYTFAYCGAICAAIGTPEQIFELSDILQDNDVSVYYTLKEPFSDDEISRTLTGIDIIPSMTRI
ncbi:MAG: hypothetical protein IKX86_01485 [Clostridia bacterium]|nr:hypothetical protein [Clostridia bacterium]